MTVYKTTNLINNKIYVGKDYHDNPNYFGSGKIIKNAIKKNGINNFKKETLEICDLSNINEREIYWIAKSDARNPNIGYNICLGGRRTGAGKNHPFYGTHRSIITRKKISNKIKMLHDIGYYEKAGPKISAKKKRVPLTDVHKAAMRHPKTEEHKASMRKPWTEERKAAAKWTEERKAAARHPKTEEQKIAMRNGWAMKKIFGLTHLEDTTKKLGQ